jgi:hypothetical protein
MSYVVWLNACVGAHQLLVNNIPVDDWVIV